MKSEGSDTKGWREYQKALKRRKRLSRAVQSAPLLILLCTFSLLVILIPLFLADSSISPISVSRDPEPPVPSDSHPRETADAGGAQAAAPTFQLKAMGLTDVLTVEREGDRLVVETSIVPGLQQFLLKKLKTSMTEKAAAVALDPSDGRVLAMAGVDKGGNGEGLCLEADFPAASLFKIVSAAAALDAAGFDPDRSVSFRGRRHTLYKPQLKQKDGRFATKTTFAQAFAESVNPVFGKLGIYHLGRETLEEYARKFMFNREIPFELPVGVSRITVPEEEFGLAEIASGFNRQTLISPLHAALLASAAANEGTIMAPWVVKRVVDSQGAVVYRRTVRPLASVVGPDKARDLRVLMRETVFHGTCRKAFRPLRRKGKTRQVDLGAKTGSINDAKDIYRYDWIVAYALPSKSGRPVCVAVLGVHGEKRGVKSQDLARQIIQYYLTSG